MLSIINVKDLCYFERLDCGKGHLYLTSGEWKVKINQLEMSHTIFCILSLSIYNWSLASDIGI